MKEIVFGILLMFLSQGIIWFQSHAQFFWDFAKKYPLIISLLGFPISYITIMATKYFYQGFGDNVWPGRLIGFACGILVFSALSYHIMGEGFSTKTLISLALALGIVLIQIFLK